MEEIEIYSITMDEAEKAAPFLLPETVAALKQGLPITALVAVKDERAVAALSGAIDGDVFEIHSLYVETDSRRKGYGRALIEKLSELLSDTETGIRAEFTVTDDEKRTLLLFFRETGFMEDTIFFPLYYIGELEDMHFGDKPTAKDIKDVYSFHEMPVDMLKAASKHSMAEGYPLPEGGLLGDNVNSNMSYCLMKDEKIEAYVTARVSGDGLIEITSVWSASDRTKEALCMLSYFEQKLKEAFPPQTKIAILAADERDDRLIHLFFEYVEPCSYRMVNYQGSNDQDHMMSERSMDI